MAKPLKFPVRHSVRFAQESDNLLQKHTKNLNIKEPSVLIRQLVDEGLARLESEEDATE